MALVGALSAGLFLISGLGQQAAEAQTTPPSSATLKAWGYNGQGQTNVPDAALNGATAISAGDFHNLALKDGGVIAWGNRYGEGSVPDAAKSGVTAIAAGRGHNLALVVPDTTAPEVTSTFPQQGSLDVLKRANVTATFSEQVKNVNTTTFKLEQVKVSKKGVETTSPVAATVAPASGTVAQGASATLDPSKDLQRGSTYRATLTNGVTDTAGNALGAPYTWTFKVSR